MYDPKELQHGTYWLNLKSTVVTWLGDKRFRWLIVAGFVAAHALVIYLNWSSYFGLIENCFLDRGSFQNLDALWAQDRLPNRDFGYSYGLLPIIVQHFWYMAFGNGIYSHALLEIAFQTLLLALIAYLLLWQLRIRPACCLLTLCLTLSLLSPLSVTSAQALVKIFLVAAMSLWVSGRKQAAWVALTFGVFSIPSLPLIALGITGLWSLMSKPADRNWFEQLKQTLLDAWPALASAIILILFLTWCFGWVPTVESLSHTRGAAMYQAMNFGFFADGRNFWAPPDSSIKHYFVTVAGLWIMCTLFLMILGLWIASGARPFENVKDHKSWTLFFICVALHFSFVLIAYGNAASHIYYDFILAIGTLAGLNLLPARAAWPLVAVLSLTSLLSTAADIVPDLMQRGRFSAGPATRGLILRNSLHPVWERIMSLSSRHRVFALSYGNGVSLPFPEIRSAKSWFLLPNITTGDELRELLSELRQAQFVVLVRAGGMQFIDGSKEIQSELKCFEVEQATEQITLLRRKPACEATSGQ